jgi:hypothetical protein
MSPASDRDELVRSWPQCGVRPSQSRARTFGSGILILAARIYLSLFATARQYRERFDVFGTLRSLERPLIERTGLVVLIAKMPLDETTEIARAPDYAIFRQNRSATSRPRRVLTCRNRSVSEGIAELILMVRIRVSSPTPALSKAMADLILIWCTRLVSALIEDRDPFPDAVPSGGAFEVVVDVVAPFACKR